MSTLQFNPASTFRPAAMLAVASFALAACSPGSTSNSNQPTKRPAVAAGDTAGGGGNAAGAGAEAGGGGGEAPGLRYQNARFHYRIDAPGTMQEAADGTASTRRGEERMSISVVTGAPAADLKGYAQSDLKQVQTSSAKYRLVQPLGNIAMAGKASLKAVYSWTDGTNPVTGKPEDLITVRYYIPRDGATAAILAYSIAASQYDPQGADDVASTFGWL